MTTAADTSEMLRGRDPAGQGDEVLRKLLQASDGTEYSVALTPLSNVNPISNTAAKAETTVSSPVRSSTNNPLLKVLEMCNHQADLISHIYPHLAIQVG